MTPRTPGTLARVAGRAVVQVDVRPVVRPPRWTRLTSSALTVSLLCLAGGCGAEPDLEAEAATLLALHERVLQAHRTGNVSDWLAVEARDYVSVNRGSITFPSLAERRAAREPYLDSTTFTVYRDLRPPIVRVSADGTLGWVLAEVEVEGTQTADGTESSIDAIWAWIELYEKQAGEWRLTGNVSNRRP